MNKEERKDLAQDTLTILKTGSYICGEEIKFDNRIKTQFFNEDKLYDIDVVVGDKSAKVSLVDENVIDTMHRLYKDYGSDVCVLNFASGYKPCGGWLNGSIAQEEAIAYSSNLYRQQTSKEGWQFYAKNREDGSKAYLNNMLLSDVTIFRDSNFDLIEDYSVVKIVTAPAVHLKRAQREGERLPESPNVIMKKRMRLILNLMVESKCNHIVLGAFGCGAYGNDPYAVSKIWKELLEDENYSNCFKSITFAIPNDRNKNYEIFRKELII